MTGSNSESDQITAEPERGDRFLKAKDNDEPVFESVNDQWEQSPRTPFERDRDRILYTREFRRLKDVTQVARSEESYLYHDRLTHSLKVAQIGRRLTELIIRRHQKISENADEIEGLSESDAYIDALDRIDPNVVEAACLAHDLGHPPFGHRIESVLDDLITEVLAKEAGDNNHGIVDDTEDVPIGFEGNAQSFRIVNSLSNSQGHDSTGLQLTRATLNAMLKYPHSRDENDDKWGYYPTEKAAFDFARELGPEEGERCLEAEIMDYADDVTYAIHDMTDFYMAGLIPLDRIFRDCIRWSESQGEEKTIEVEETSELGKFVRYITDYDVEKTPHNEIPSKEEVAELFYQLLDRLPGTYDGVENSESDTETENRATSELLTPFQGTPKERREIDSFTSELITRYLGSNDQYDPKQVYLDKRESGGGYTLNRPNQIDNQVWILRKLTEFYVIRDSTLMAQQRGEEELIRELFYALYEESCKDDYGKSAIPEPYQTWLEWCQEDDVRCHEESEINQARFISDLITSLTEPQAVRLHARLTGRSLGSLQDKIIK